MGPRDERCDVRIGEITFPDGGETRNGSVIVSCAGGCIRIGVLCRRLEHLVLPSGKGVVESRGDGRHYGS